MHEQIENEYIIGLLQQRCCTVYNVHSDNKLSEMLSLFEKGLQNVKVNMHSERLAVLLTMAQQKKKKKNTRVTWDWKHIGLLHCSIDSGLTPCH